MIKKEIGDVPVLMGLSNIPGKLLPYFSGLYSNYIDGLYLQIHAAMPEEVKFHAEQLPHIRVLNSCTKTKLFWGYGQTVVSGSTPLYRSRQLMHDHFRAMVDAGMTGFAYDQLSSLGFIEWGIAPDSWDIRENNKNWWGELKPVLKGRILDYANNNQFRKGKWTVAITPTELTAKNPKVLTAEQVNAIVLDNSEIQRVVALGAEVAPPVFDPDYGLWSVYLLGLDTVIWIDDTPGGPVVLDGLKMNEDARQVGYPIPSDEWMLGNSNN